MRRSTPLRPSSVLILTGAGISAESGVETFRDKSGIWSRVRLADVATPEAFARDPAMVHEFYNSRRAQLSTIEPNAAHRALAKLEQLHEGAVMLVTQNIDDLHERAGSRNVVHMHGELNKALCATCGARSMAEGDLSVDLSCAACGQRGGMRPDVVWFGEIPYHMDEIYKRLTTADLFIAIGTSGAVYPAAGFVAEARAAGVRTVELNLDPSAVSHLFNDSRHGKASVLVPAFVDEILAGSY